MSWDVRISCSPIRPAAQASVIIYSVMETANANALEPYRYLLFLLEEFPNADRRRADRMEPFLPWNAPNDCRINASAAQV